MQQKTNSILIVSLWSQRLTIGNANYLTRINT